VLVQSLLSGNKSRYCVVNTGENEDLIRNKTFDYQYAALVWSSRLCPGLHLPDPVLQPNLC
jgi:hypothetical protein